MNSPLKILIVEDNPNKKRKLFERLSQSPNLFAEPEVVVCAVDAIRRLQERDFDLMILDVFLPFKVNGEPEEQHSMDLLSRIDAGTGGLKRPKHVAVISSQDKLSRVASEFFQGRPWGCIHYSEDSDQSLVDVENVAKWIFADRNANSIISKCDIFIIAALEEPEFTALEAELPELGPLLPLDSTHLVRFCSAETKDGPISLAVGFATRMGPVASAILATKALELLKPKAIIMAGICGAIATKADIGDVIAADMSWDWQSGKHVNKDGNDFELAPHHLPMSELARNLLISLKRDTDYWKSFIEEAVKLKVNIPKLIVGPMATGAAVIADDRITKKIKEEQNKNVVGIDMETYAVYAAASAGYRVAALSLKAVCDKANINKNDDYQAYSAKVSARTVVKLIKEHGAQLMKISN